MKLEIYDTTLRDGAQGAGIALAADDKPKIISALDALGISLIEAGNFDSEADLELLESLSSLRLSSAKLCAFGNTVRAGMKVEEDSSLTAAVRLPIETLTIVGKSSRRQTAEVLRVSDEENFRMIRDTIAFLRGAEKRVIFDAEHFFDGYGDDPPYALETLRIALDAGAAGIALCDTNGGMLPDAIGVAVKAVREHFPDADIGIHCHNDAGLAVASTVTAVLGGAKSIQGSISGIGERCGNADLCTLIPLLQLKLGYQCVPEDKLARLSQTARRINELANLTFNERAPFVGGYAFAHKAGTHIDAVVKSSSSFEHIDPSLVGNDRNFLVSALSGRAAIRDKLMRILPGVTKNSPEVEIVTSEIRKLESEGWQYENAEASLMLRFRSLLGSRKRFFEIEKFQVTINEGREDTLTRDPCAALIKVSVGDQNEITAAEGEGPVNALDAALRKALGRFYPELSQVRLSDYRVRVLAGSEATASRVRVYIESTDGVRVWRTVGLSRDIIDASRDALCDALEYKLAYERGLM